MPYTRAPSPPAQTCLEHCFHIADDKHHVVCLRLQGRWRSAEPNRYGQKDAILAASGHREMCKPSSRHLLRTHLRHILCSIPNSHHAGSRDVPSDGLQVPLLRHPSRPRRVSVFRPHASLATALASASSSAPPLLAFTAFTDVAVRGMDVCDAYLAVWGKEHIEVFGSGSLTRVVGPSAAAAAPGTPPLPIVTVMIYVVVVAARKL